jgi:hypothetical protein
MAQLQELATNAMTAAQEAKDQASASQAAQDSVRQDMERLSLDLPDELINKIGAVASAQTIEALQQYAAIGGMAIPTGLPDGVDPTLPAPDAAGATGTDGATPSADEPVIPPPLTAVQKFLKNLQA